MLDEIMSKIDAFVYDQAKLPYRGWHGDYDDLPMSHYLPMIQQDRAEYREFLRHVIAFGLRGTAVQIGLGMGGAAHFALRQVFDRVVTVDVDLHNIERFRSYYHVTDSDVLLHGNSFYPGTIAQTFDTATGADLLFIDGGHMFSEAQQDWRNFHRIVRPGGFVCFHDAVTRPAMYDALQIDAFLGWLERQPDMPPMVRIGHTLGIAYYVVDH